MTTRETLGRGNARGGLIDEVDLAIIRQLVARPGESRRQHAHVLGIARGTLQSRIARLERLGVLRPGGPVVSLAAIGYEVVAFVHIQLAQGQLDNVTSALSAIGEVIEVHSIAGEGDLLCRVAAKSTLHLEEVVQKLVAVKGVARTKTEIAMAERVSSRIDALLQLFGTGSNSSS